MFKKFLKDLVRSSVDPDKSSHTKLWSNIGMAAMTIVFLWYGYQGTLPEWYMWVYAPTVAAPNLLSKLINLRWGVPIQEKDDSKNKEDN